MVEGIDSKYVIALLIAIVMLVLRRRYQTKLTLYAKDSLEWRRIRNNILGCRVVFWGSLFLGLSGVLLALYSQLTGV